MGPQLAAPVALLHAFAFGLGYFMCKVLGFNEKTARTVSIETGAPFEPPTSPCTLSSCTGLVCRSLRAGPASWTVHFS